MSFPGKSNLLKIKAQQQMIKKDYQSSYLWNKSYGLTGNVIFGVEIEKRPMR